MATHPTRKPGERWRRWRRRLFVTGRSVSIVASTTLAVLKLVEYLGGGGAGHLL